MVFNFAYTDVLGYDYDWKKAKQKKALVEFTLEIAQITPVKNISSTPLQTELLDGNIWELKTRYRKSISFTTFPDLMLYTIKASDGKTYKAGDLIRNWLFARARFLLTDDIYTEGDVESYAKMVRVTNDFAPDIQGNVFFLQSVTIEVSTAAPYKFGN